MPKLLSLSKAARLADVSRSEMQNRIREEEAKTFEGKITIEVLQRLYPHIDLESNPVLDRVQRIKAEARPKSRYGDGWIPDPKMLMRRLHAFHRSLVQTKSTLNTSEALVEVALEELIRSADSSEERLRGGVTKCISRLEQVLQRMRWATNATVTQFDKETLLDKEMLPKVVSASVRILPSGREFLLEGSDTILEAGLKAGFYLEYGCSSHNCGKCKCKAVSGGVHKIHDHDYLLSAREQEEGYILACCYTAESDLVIAATEGGVEEDIPYQEIRAIVRKIKHEGDKLALLQVQTPRSQSLRFKAGQQAKLITEDGSANELYIASCPCDGRNLQFMFARQSWSVFSDSVFDGTLAKQKVLLKGPTGHFVLQEESTASALFVACGQGFAPIKSLVEQAINIDNAEELHLIQVGCYPSGSSLDNLCRAWNDSLENFHYTATPSETGVISTIPPLPPRHREDLAELLAAAISGTSRVDVYLAGPADWLQALLEAAHSKGLAPRDWHCQAVD